MGGWRIESGGTRQLKTAERKQVWAGGSSVLNTYGYTFDGIGKGNDVRNLVPLFQNPANHPIMSGFEHQVKAAVRAEGVVRYWAVPVYHGDELIPFGIHLKALGSDGFTLDQFIWNTLAR